MTLCNSLSNISSGQTSKTENELKKLMDEKEYNESYENHTISVNKYQYLEVMV